MRFAGTALIPMPAHASGPERMKAWHRRGTARHRTGTGVALGIDIGTAGGERNEVDGWVRHGDS